MSSSAAAPSTPKRTMCRRCLRPQSACICDWITPLVNQVEVLILQHPQEASQAKGSARLLHLSLARSQLHTGEIFAPAVLQALLQRPWP
ncbi:MAG TPA: DTW domain-containing protein, partial [Burkholderiaceae bacterium]|nr:DTW domain-containing protein [Burkholderiaceae bacterium]